MNPGDSLFTIGILDYKLQIPILGLCDEMKKSLVLSSIPFWFLATKHSVFNCEKMVNFYAFIIVLILLEKAFSRDPFQSSQCTFISNFSSMIFTATALYLVTVIIQNFLTALSDYWKLYLLESIFIFLIFVYWQSPALQYFCECINKVLMWVGISLPERLLSTGDSMFNNQYQEHEHRNQTIQNMTVPNQATTETPPHHHRFINNHNFNLQYETKTRLLAMRPTRRLVRSVCSCHR